jgi:Holliday junction resolvase RusA-like endonuclease
MRPHYTEQDFTAMMTRVRGGGNAMPDDTAPQRRSVTNPAPSPLILALTGQVPSGKNQVQLSFRNGKVHKYPNKTFTNWRSKAHIQIEEQQLPAVRTPTITTPVRLTVEYWPGDARTRDVSGQLDALFSLLVYSKVLKNDGLVHDVIWRRQVMNRKFPKAVMEIVTL